MLAQELAAAGANDGPEGEDDHHRVVELAGDRDEVGHEVERQREVAE